MSVAYVTQLYTANRNLDIYYLTTADPGCLTLLPRTARTPGVNWWLAVPQDNLLGTRAGSPQCHATTSRKY